MEQDTLNQAIVQAVSAVRSDVQAIYRFGSTLTPYARPDSDLDVALLLPAPLAFDDRLLLMAGIARVSGRDGDIMDLHGAGPVAHMQVLATGERIFVGDELAMLLWETRALREYQDFKTRRRPLEQHVLQHGFA